VHLNNEILRAKKEKKSSSNSNDDTSEIEELKYLLETERNKNKEQLKDIEKLKREIHVLKDEKENREKELESEFDRLAQSQSQIKSLTEKQEALIKENEQLKRGGPTYNTQPTTPRGINIQSGNIPAWKQRELERQRDMEEQREKESKAKLQKVQSLKDQYFISHETENKNFIDPLLTKPVITSVAEHQENEKSSSTVANPDLEEQEKVELARMQRVFKKGGHAL